MGAFSPGGTISLPLLKPCHNTLYCTSITDQYNSPKIYCLFIALLVKCWLGQKAYSCIFRHIQAHSDIFRHNQAYSGIIHAYSETCVTLTYSESCHSQNPGIFETRGILISLVYSKFWHIQNQRHIQNPGLFRTLGYSET